MEQKITFNIKSEDKRILLEEAEKQRLPLSSFCRNIIINSLFERFSDGKGRLEDFEELEKREDSN